MARSQNYKKIELPAVKRIFDIIVSFVLLFPALPFLLFLFSWMMLEQLLLPSSRGRIFYSELRVSQGEEFKFYKFRIFKQKVLDWVMKEKGFIHTKALENNLKNMTYYGRFLKRVYMDELPQLYNVLRGDMTLVGPRPTNVINSRNMRKQGIYTKEIMKCGITGLVQINKENLSQGDVKLDLEYINFCRKNSGWKIVLHDLRILYSTIAAIFRAKGL